MHSTPVFYLFGGLDVYDVQRLSDVLRRDDAAERFMRAQTEF